MANPTFNMRYILGYYGQLGLLRGNRFLVNITPTGRISSNVFASNNRYGYLARSVRLPDIDFGSTSYDVGGQVAQNLEVYSPKTITMSVFDTGPEYSTMYEYSMAVYDPTTGAYAYPDDITCDVTIYEYDQTDEMREWHTYQRCFLQSISGKQYSHTNGEDFSTFDMTFLYNYQVGGM